MVVNNAEAEIQNVNGGAGTDDNTNMQQIKTEKWVTDIIGEFLLKTYLDQRITHRNEWMVSKMFLRSHFNKFLDEHKDQNLRVKINISFGKVDIGTLLYRTRFLTHTPRGNDSYRIRSYNFFQYYNEQLNACDERRKNGESQLSNANAAEGAAGASPASAASNDAAAANGVDPALLACFNVDTDAKSYPLTYEGSVVEALLENFELTNMGCYICQCNYDTAENFERHVEKHTDDSDFELLQAMTKHEMPKLSLSYQLCKNSHYFCFTLATATEAALALDIIIDKIIVVQSSSMYYVHNTRVPYELPASGKETFFVDSHLFTKDMEYPIVVVFHSKRVANARLIEQHHFMRTEEFPMVQIAYNPNRLLNKKLFKAKVQLSQYSLDRSMRDALSQEFAVEVLQRKSAQFADYIDRSKTLTMDNHVKALEMLLQIEDMATICDYTGLMQRNVHLRRSENEYTLKLKSNKRNVDNILSPCDEVMILPESDLAEMTGSDDDIEKQLFDRWEENTQQQQQQQRQQQHSMKKRFIKGMVERAANQSITFVCYHELKLEQTYALIFRPARLPVRYQYRALELLAALPLALRQRIFFPDVRRIPAVPINLLLTLKNETIYENREQYQAVLNITLGERSNAPYIIIGPPGTGKTTTITEAILQLYLLQSESRILVTAGSNSACDEVALRLCQVLAPMDKREAIVRIYSRTNERRMDNIDELLLEHSNMYAGQFYPDIEVLHSYRIIICTLSVVGKLGTANFGRTESDRYCFTHVFVDEASASTEPETMVGIVGTVGPSTRLIISGDHKQLGPILLSPLAEKLGLGVTLMERLLSRDCYAIDDHGDYDHAIMSRLCRNFRSHAAIVRLYSGMYYNHELLPLADSDDIRVCEKWHKAPNTDYPIIFHSVFGSMQRTYKSTSLFNLKEVQIVMDYVKDLMYFGVNGRRIKADDIGIISPYRLQYQRIQEELNLRNWYGIETGSVETFQGREKLIIIVSFVRSFTTELGFLDNPRRLNVVLSRAKGLLIMIGNPKVLKLNDDFKHVFDECVRFNSRVGTDERAHRNSVSLTDTLDQDTIKTEQIIANAEPSMQPAKAGKKKYKKKNKNKALANGASNDNNVSRSSPNTKTATATAAVTASGDNRRTSVDQMFDELPSVPSVDIRRPGPPVDTSRKVTYSLAELHACRQPKPMNSIAGRRRDCSPLVRATPTPTATAASATRQRTTVASSTVASSSSMARATPTPTFGYSERSRVESWIHASPVPHATSTTVGSSERARVASWKSPMPHATPTAAAASAARSQRTTAPAPPSSTVASTAASAPPPPPRARGASSTAASANQREMQQCLFDNYPSGRPVIHYPSVQMSDVPSFGAVGGGGRTFAYSTQGAYLPVHNRPERRVEKKNWKCVIA